MSRWSFVDYLSVAMPSPFSVGWWTSGARENANAALWKYSAEGAEAGAQASAAQDWAAAKAQAEQYRMYWNLMNPGSMVPTGTGGEYNVNETGGMDPALYNELMDRMNTISKENAALYGMYSTISQNTTPTFSPEAVQSLVSQFGSGVQSAADSVNPLSGISKWLKKWGPMIIVIALGLIGLLVILWFFKRRRNAE